MMGARQMIPARKGKAAFVAAGRLVTVINTHGLHQGLADLDLVAPEVPSPLYLFMDVLWTPDGTLSFAAPPRAIPRGSVSLRAEMGLVVAWSAYPQDIQPISGQAACRSRRISASTTSRPQ